MYIPPGFNTVAPYFIVEGAQAFIDFLIDGLGGEETSRTPGEGGVIKNAHVRLGTSTVMVSESSGRFPPMTGTYYLYVTDADSAMAQALAHGGSEVMEVADMPYGDRQGGVRDTHGNIWWISQRLVEAPYQD